MTESRRTDISREDRKNLKRRYRTIKPQVMAWILDKLAHPDAVKMLDLINAVKLLDYLDKSLKANKSEPNEDAGPTIDELKRLAADLE